MARRQRERYSVRHKVDDQLDKRLMPRRHGPLKMVAKHDLPSYDGSHKVDDRSDWQPRRQKKHFVFHENKDWSQVQSRWHQNNTWRGKGSRTKLLKNASTGQLIRSPTSLPVPPRVPEPRGKRASLIETLNPLSRGRRQSIVDGISAVGEGIQTIFGFVPTERPKTRGGYASTDEKAGLYSKTRLSPLLEGSGGGGGLRVAPPHLKAPEGVSAIRRMRASLVGLFSGDDGD